MGELGGEGFGSSSHIAFFCFYLIVIFSYFVYFPFVFVGASISQVLSG